MLYLIYYDTLAKLLFEDKDFSRHRIVPRVGENIELPGSAKIQTVNQVFYNYNTKVIAIVLK